MLQFQPDTINGTFTIIGEIAIAVVASLGIGNLLLAAYQRYTRKRDQRELTHDTNRSKEIEADDRFQERLLKRVERLEGELDKMQDEQLQLARTNERLTVENENLKRENEWQEKEIKNLQETVSKLQTQIAELQRK